MYKHTRTHKNYKAKPYMWYVYDEDLGFAYSFFQVENSRIVFNPRTKGYCGWDIDRHRFVCRPHNEKFPKKLKTHWYWIMLND